MTNYNNTLNWKDTVKYGVSVCDFLIRGKGSMTGKQFADVIRQHYDSEKMSIIANCIEAHISCILAGYTKTAYFFK